MNFAGREVNKTNKSCRELAAGPASWTAGGPCPLFPHGEQDGVHLLPSERGILAEASAHKGSPCPHRFCFFSLQRTNRGTSAG